MLSSRYMTSVARERREVLAILALVLAALFWSGNFIAGRALRDDIDPITLNFIRWALCLVLFLPLVGRRLARHWRTVLREWRLLVGLGGTGIALFHSLVYRALLETTAVNALLILALAPAAILAGATLAGEVRPSAPQWAGCLLSLAGAVVLVTRGDPTELREIRVNPGDVWMLAAVLIWTAYSLLLRRRPADLPQDVTLAASIVVALASLAPVLLITRPAPLDLGLGEISVIFYVAVFASLIAFLLWSFGVNELGAARSGQFVYLMPVFGPVLSVLILGEAIGLEQLTGAGLVFVGIVLVSRKANTPPGIHSR